MRPAVGEALRRCPSCGGWEYGGAPDCPRCAELVDAIVEEGWRDVLLREFGDRVAPADERAIAEMVADEPDRHDWRVVDAALDRLTCAECGGPLGRQAGCPRCDVANGIRYVARETDRPGVPPGNEHAIRVNVSVVRRPEGISVPEVLARRLLLPALLTGFLPTREQAQRLGALVKRGARAEDLAVAIDELAAAAG
ncbi:hypothetical protein IL992_09945 [Microbispora sp. NEAU-D428]|uniref:hypothetical protein n=1 Tax=Microbispora sitophila TaxID=2771537 RepID=UPI001867E76A|nr:hypothetical protein [Microbispora sitophila]MBE3009519.1 hypothetical protein [Microbispora sitophila]